MLVLLQRLVALETSQPDLAQSGLGSGLALDPGAARPGGARGSCECASKAGIVPAAFLQI